MQATYDVAVVIPTYNRAKDLLGCVDSVYAQTGIRPLVIVINDGSSDNTTTLVQARCPDIVVLEGDGNLWWSGATNLGIEYAILHKIKYVLLLNDDNILGDGSLSTLLGYAEQHPGVIIGSIVLIKDTQMIAYAGGGVDWMRGGTFLMDYRQPYHQQYNDVFNVGFLGGQGVLIPMSVFERVGRFDQKTFPQYYGDADFYLRAQAVGVSVVVHPKSIVFDGENPDGFPRYGFRKGIRKFVEAYTSRRSPVNIVDTTRFFVRHCPLWLVPWALSRKLLGFARGFIRSSLSST